MFDATQETLITAVARRLDITPDAPAVLASSPVQEPSTAVFEPLEANLLLLRQGSEIFLFVTLDLLYAGAAVRKAISDKLGSVDAAHLMVAGSHTHYAPSTLDDKPALGQVDAGYLSTLTDRLRSCVEAMISTPGEPVTCWQIAAGDLDHSINRRLRTRRGVKMAPDRSGPRDERATVLSLGGKEAPLAIIWNYACHPVSHPRPRMVAAHYPAVTRERLRKEYDRADLPVLFFQGFSGDTRPSATTRWRRPKDLALFVRFGRGFYDMSLAAYQRWSGTLAAGVVALARTATPIAVTGIAARRTHLPLEDFVSGGTPGKQVAFHRLDLEPSVTMLGASAEIVSPVALDLRSNTPVDHFLLPVACLDDCFGYLPTPDMMRAGGYEAGGFCSAFGYNGMEDAAAARGRAALLDLMNDAS